MSSAALALAEAQLGLVARHQLRSMGWSFASIDSLARSRNWDVVSTEVLRRVGAPRSAEQRALAAVLDAGPGAVLSHFSAAAWWGLGGFDLVPAHVTRTGSSRRASTLAMVHRVRVLPDRWTTVLRSVPIVRPELLALQLHAVCRPERAERAVERLWSMRVLSGPSILRFLDELGERGRNGTAGLRRYSDVRGEHYLPSSTSLEARVDQILRESGIPVRRQVDSGSDRWIGRVDFRHVAQPMIIEVQSEMYHDALVDRAGDEQRIAQLRAAGFEVVEVTDVQVWNRPWEVVSEARAALARLDRVL